MYLASGEHRKSTTEAMSSGWPTRPMGIRASCQARPSSVASELFVISVAIVPGATALTLIPWGASSAAIETVIWRTAPLLASYTTSGFDDETKADVEAKFTILPWRLGIITRAASWQQKKTALTLTLIWRSQSSSV